MVRLKQIFGLKRYFIVVYMYQNDKGQTGQGQCTITTDGNYFSIDNLVKGVENDLDTILDKFFILNVMEMNRRDFHYYKENSKETINK